ncbi:3'-5' exoribonuclease YhaM family protein [Candidatus Omnitrophota bacterium]
MDKKFISDFKDKERVDSFFMLRKKNIKLTKYDKPYLELSLSDKTGKIEGRLWEKAEEFGKLVDTGDVVHVKGAVDKFREEKQLKVDSIERADDRAFRYEDMVRVVENRDKIRDDVIKYLENIKNPWICLLVEQFLEDDDLMSMLKDGVGAKSWHNAYIGGLIEHTYEVMRIVEAMCQMYPEADRDVAVFGAFIHDIGKVYELDAKNLEYTIEGGLVGHIAIGHEILRGKIRNIPDFPGSLRLRLEHIILSHHGEYEQQSPVLPKTLEATIVYQADELVSQANAVKEIQRAQAEEGKVWSNFVSIKNRKYYIRRTQDEEEVPPEAAKD